MSPIHEPQFAWFLWSILLIIIWSGVYGFLRDAGERRKMLKVSVLTALVGITEPFFVPEYWSPPSLFDLAHRTGFDIESFIFSFGIGGIAVVLYELFVPVSRVRLTTSERHAARHRQHLWAILSAPILFVALTLTTSLNPIHSAVIALMIGGFATWYCRPDLKRVMIVGGILFTVLYFVYFLTLIAAYPGYVQQVWRLELISGILIVGIPLEELLFAFSFGFLWASIYEHWAWQKLSRRTT